MKPYVFLLAVVVLVVAIVSSSFVSVAETEFAIVTRFGKPVRVSEEPGLRFKLPWPLEAVTRVDRRMQVLDPPRASATDDEFLTADKKQVLVSCFSVWRVEDPLQYLVSVGDAERAESRLDDLIRSEVQTKLSEYELRAFLPLSGSTGGEDVELRTEIDAFMADVTGEVAKSARESFGIDVRSVRVKRLNYPEQNKSAVYSRMRAERERISTQIREEGKKEADKIVTDAEYQRSEILAKANREAKGITGKADADATRIYSEAYSKAPELFVLLRELEILERVLGPDDWLYLDKVSDLASLLDVLPDSMPETPTPKREGDE